MIGVCRLCPKGVGDQELRNSGLCTFHHDIHGSKLVLTPDMPAKNMKRDKEIKNALDEYFNHHIAKAFRDGWICENCNEPIPDYSYIIRRSAQAHILPKKPKQFPSVATVLNNHLLLGGMHSKCGCHAKWDLSWERASRMPVLEIAKERFLTFRHLIAPNEVKYLPDFFLKLM